MKLNSFFFNIYSGVKLRISKFTRNENKKANLNWFHLKYYKHLPASQNIRTHTLAGKKIYFKSPSELLHGLKEIFVEEIYKQDFTKDSLIIDCGANIGMSVIYLKQLAPDSTIIAFEPDPDNFTLLQKNINSFNLQNVTPRNEAVWNKNTTLHFSAEGSMSSRITTDGETKTINITASRLKDFINQKVQFLKIDIEGAEYEVLLDIKEKLYHVDNLFLEYHSSFKDEFKLHEILQVIHHAGFNTCIKEATSIYNTPFKRDNNSMPYDIQLNIFCFRPKINDI